MADPSESRAALTGMDASLDGSSLPMPAAVNLLLKMFCNLSKHLETLDSYYDQQMAQHIDASRQELSKHVIAMESTMERRVTELTQRLSQIEEDMKQPTGEASVAQSGDMGKASNSLQKCGIDSDEGVSTDFNITPEKGGLSALQRIPRWSSHDNLAAAAAPPPPVPTRLQGELRAVTARVRELEGACRTLKQIAGGLVGRDGTKNNTNMKPAASPRPIVNTIQQEMERIVADIENLGKVGTTVKSKGEVSRESSFEYVQFEAPEKNGVTEDVEQEGEECNEEDGGWSEFLGKETGEAGGGDSGRKQGEPATLVSGVVAPPSASNPLSRPGSQGNTDMVVATNMVMELWEGEDDEHLTPQQQLQEWMQMDSPSEDQAKPLLSLDLQGPPKYETCLDTWATSPVKSPDVYEDRLEILEQLPSMYYVETLETDVDTFQESTLKLVRVHLETDMDKVEELEEARSDESDDRMETPLDNVPGLNKAAAAAADLDVLLEKMGRPTLPDTRAHQDTEVPRTHQLPVYPGQVVNKPSDPYSKSSSSSDPYSKSSSSLRSGTDRWHEAPAPTGQRTGLGKTSTGSSNGGMYPPSSLNSQDRQQLYSSLSDRERTLSDRERTLSHTSSQTSNGRSRSQSTPGYQYSYELSSSPGGGTDRQRASSAHSGPSSPHLSQRHAYQPSSNSSSPQLSIRSVSSHGNQPVTCNHSNGSSQPPSLLSNHVPPGLGRYPPCTGCQEALRLQQQQQQQQQHPPRPDVCSASLVPSKYMLAKEAQSVAASVSTTYMLPGGRVMPSLPPWANNSSRKSAQSLAPPPPWANTTTPRLPRTFPIPPPPPSVRATPSKPFTSTYTSKAQSRVLNSFGRVVPLRSNSSGSLSGPERYRLLHQPCQVAGYDPSKPENSYHARSLSAPSTPRTTHAPFLGPALYPDRNYAAQWSEKHFSQPMANGSVVRDRNYSSGSVGYDWIPSHGGGGRQWSTLGNGASQELLDLQDEYRVRRPRTSRSSGSWPSPPSPPRSRSVGARGTGSFCRWWWNCLLRFGWKLW